MLTKDYEKCTEATRFEGVLPRAEGLVVLVAAARGKLSLRLDQLPDGATGVEARWVFGAVILVGLGVIPSLGLPVDANR